MKCGRETKNEHVFCDSCLEVMKQHPVKPGAFIQLPSRPAPSPAKKVQPRKRVLPPEEQIKKLRKAVLWLSAALVASVLALAISVSLLHASSAESEGDTIGQNYNTAETTAATD